VSARLSLLIDKLPIGIALIGPDQRLCAFNRVYLQLLDLPDDAIRPGDPVEALFRYKAARGFYGPGDSDVLLAEQLHAVRSGELHTYEWTLPNGRINEVRRVPLADGSVITTLIDVTEARRRERELTTAHATMAEQAEKLAAANQAKAQFLANMSHELRTPLNAILGFSEVLRDGVFGPIDPRYAEYAKDINASGAHLLTLVNDLLDLAKIESGKAELRNELVDLREILDECCRLVADRAATAHVSLITSTTQQLPTIIADGVRLRQIALNLLSNAIKFTPAGGRVTLSVEIEPREVIIAVADTGIGMRPEDIPLALEPFRQLDNSYSRSHEGSGLGLAITKTLTELHDGKLEIKSRPSEGTTVRVRLPATRLAAAMAATRDRSSPGGK
jgi:signal transduction histidine kinase